MNKFKLLPLFLVLLFFLSACDSSIFSQNEDTIQIIETTIAENYDIDVFDLSSIEIQVTKQNGSIEIVPLKPEMLSESDLNKLLTPGTHFITITHLNSEITIEITMRYSDLKTSLLEIYEVYTASQVSSLSYDEWIDSIKGEDGVSIIDALINEQGHLILTFSNNEVVDVGRVNGNNGSEVLLRIEENRLEWQYEGDIEWKILIELSTLIGPIGKTGEDGKDVTFRMGINDIEWQYVGETTWQQLISIDSLIGPMGIGITDVLINTLGEMIITYSDESTQNLGQIYTFYVVQFKDGEGYVLDTQHLVYGADAIPPLVPEKEGYLFLKWDKDYSKVTTNIVITALYSIETYTVTFESNGGSDCDEITDVDFGSTIELPIPVKEGYIFSGWYNSNLITASPFYDDSLVKSHLILYARWSAQDFSIKFIDDDQSILATQYIKHEETVIQPIHPIRLGYDFIGWYEDETYTTLYDFKQKPNASIDIYAHWELITYQIAYELNLGASPDNLPATYSVLSETILLLVPTRLGYEFLGWYTDAEFTDDPMSEITKGSTGDLTLYANWNLIKYTITYELDGGENNTENPEYYTMFDFSITIFFPFKKGYIFSGWTIDQDFFDYHQDTLLLLYTFMQTSNVTLSANWELAEFNVVYLLNGGINNADNINSFTMISESFVLLDPTRSGCPFLGWYSDSMFEGNPITEIPSGTLEDIILQAKWEIPIYNIFYTLNGGINHADNLETYHVDSENFILFNPEREGYNFLGWYDNSLFENEVVSSFESYLGSDVTFYAKWEIIISTISYELDGGTNHENNPETYHIDMENIILNDPERTIEWRFEGWYEENTYYNRITHIDVTQQRHITLYALWALREFTTTCSEDGEQCTITYLN